MGVFVLVQLSFKVHRRLIHLSAVASLPIVVCFGVLETALGCGGARRIATCTGAAHEIPSAASEAAELSVQLAPSVWSRCEVTVRQAS